MGNGSGAVLARRVDGAQLEWASAASWLVPARALAEGGTAVTAHGSGFSSASEAAGDLLCRVGGAARRARWASARALVRGGALARGRGAARGEQQRARVQRGRGAAAAGVGARARRAAVERPAARRDGGRRARGG